MIIELTNMAAVPLFSYINMPAVTSRENTPLLLPLDGMPVHGRVYSSSMSLVLIYTPG